MRLYVNTRLHASNRLTVTTVYQKSFEERDSDTFAGFVLFVANKIYRVNNLGSLDSSVFRL